MSYSDIIKNLTETVSVDIAFVDLCYLLAVLKLSGMNPHLVAYLEDVVNSFLAKY